MKDIINSILGHADTIIAEANRAGLEIALACAIVEQESNGRNIFGCDHGNVGDKPPYCGQDVTKQRVARLRDRGNYGFGMNGVGLTQLTWWEFVEEAESLGGAHLTENQCRVGFKLLKSYLDKYPLLEALGAYNAGENNRHSIIATYAAAVNSKYKEWQKKLAITPKYPTVPLVEKANAWVGEDGTDRWARTKPNMTLYSDGEGWVYVPKAKEIVTPDSWEWPKSDAAPIPGSAWYTERHPTRYFWRPDVEAWARWLVNNYAVWCNTYYEHPEGYGFDPSEADPAWLVQNTSLDVWAKKGRGYALEKTLGDALHSIVFNDSGLPDIDWIIWQGWMWTAGGGWEWFSNDTSDADMGHWKHIHITYK